MGDDPSWMGGGAGGGGTRQSSSNAPRPSEAASGDIGPPAPFKKPTMAACLVMNLGLGLCVAFNGVMAIGHKSNSNDVGVLFVAVYMIIFSSILIFYEMIQICPFQLIDAPFKRNFGFLYGVFGKCCYLVL